MKYDEILEKIYKKHKFLQKFSRKKWENGQFGFMCGEIITFFIKLENYTSIISIGLQEYLADDWEIIDETEENLKIFFDENILNNEKKLERKNIKDHKNKRGE